MARTDGMMIEDISIPARDFVYTRFALQPEQVNHIYFQAITVSCEATQE